MEIIPKPKVFNVDGRKSLETLLTDLQQYLSQISLHNWSNKKNPNAFCEDTSAAGRAEAYRSAASLLEAVIEKKLSK